MNINKLDEIEDLLPFYTIDAELKDQIKKTIYRYFSEEVANLTIP